MASKNTFEESKGHLQVYFFTGLTPVHLRVLLERNL